MAFRALAIRGTVRQLAVLGAAVVVVVGLASLLRTAPCGAEKGEWPAGSVAAEYRRATESRDIGAHMETLLLYARQCTHITELGVRGVVSSWAFLQGLVEHKAASGGAATHTLLACDPVMSNNVFTLQREAEQNGVRFTFMLGDDLVAPMEPTDAVFIDTWHLQGQLSRELRRMHALTRKWILLHDTVVDAEVGEAVRVGWDIPALMAKTGWPREDIVGGLMPAVSTVLAAGLCFCACVPTTVCV